MPMSGQQMLHECLRAQTEILTVTPAHAAQLDGLPLFHRDPFDRLMIAQAQSENMYLLTHDKTLAAYGDFVIVV
jgi:PIN domain nuclease of toxin-antitoxin system